MKDRLALFITLAAASFFFSCSPTPSAPPANTNNSGHTVQYLLTPTSLPQLLPTEHYVFWVRLYGSATYLKMGELRASALTFTGRIPGAISPDTVDEVRISVEADTSVNAPGAQFLGAHRAGSDTLALSCTAGLGDFDNVTGIATFASANPDTTVADHEFYFMSLNGHLASSSLLNLPVLAPGWHYATFVVDSSYFPAHLFYYGEFLVGQGHDSDSLHDTFAFPGGFEPPSLANSNGMIEVTLEPDFRMSALRTMGPSPIHILEALIPHRIYWGEAVTMSNVWQASPPSATLALTQH